VHCAYPDQEVAAECRDHKMHIRTVPSRLTSNNLQTTAKTKGDRINAFAGEKTREIES